MSQQIKLLQKTGIIAIDGPSFQLENHHHHALQVVINLDVAPSSHLFSVENNLIDSPGLIIAPNITHKIKSSHCLVLLIEAESHLAESLSNNYIQKANYYSIPLEFCRQIIKLFLEENFGWSTLDSVLNLLDSDICLDRHIQPRLQKLVNWFDEVEVTSDWESVNLTAALDKIQLSQGRFLHLFSEQFGITWRQYVLWRRLLAAIKYALAGYSLTASAQQACFSDSAHFSRVFKSMFGISPSLVIKNIKLQQ